MDILVDCKRKNEFPYISYVSINRASWHNNDFWQHPIACITTLVGICSFNLYTHYVRVCCCYYNFFFQFHFEKCWFRNSFEMVYSNRLKYEQTEWHIVSVSLPSADTHGYMQHTHTQPEWDACTNSTTYAICIRLLRIDTVKRNQKYIKHSNRYDEFVAKPKQREKKTICNTLLSFSLSSCLRLRLQFTDVYSHSNTIISILKYWSARHGVHF